MQTSLANNDSWYGTKMIPVLDEGKARLKARVARHKVNHFLLQTVKGVTSTSHFVTSLN